MADDMQLGRQRDRDHKTVDPTRPEGDTTSYLPAQRYQHWSTILEYVRTQINVYLTSNRLEMDELRNRITFNEAVQGMMEQHAKVWEVERSQFATLSHDLYSEFFGYGALSQWLNNREVEDILLNNYQWMDVVIKGKKHPIQPTPFNSDEEVKNWLQTVVFNPVGEEFNRSNPAENAMLRDGSRVFAFTQPISASTGFAIRRHRTEVFSSPQEYIETGIAPEAFFLELRNLVRDKRNMVFAGATGSGKTTMINFAASLVPKEERIVTLEDTPELQIAHPRILSLQTHEKGARAKGEGDLDIPMRDLLRYSLRLAPDRIIVGETRDAEAFDMLDILNTGHPGSFTSLHANSTIDAITRLQTMAIRAEVDFPINAIQDLIASVIDIVVQIKNFNGNRRIVAVDQVLSRYHYRQFEHLKDVWIMYPNLGMHSLWAWNAELEVLEKVSDYIKPDHE